MSTNELGGNKSIEHNRSRVPVAGGALVYEHRAVGRKLVGVEEVTDWDVLGDALAARGHGRGAVDHLDTRNKLPGDQ